MEDEDTGWPYLKFDNDELNTENDPDHGSCIWIEDYFLEIIE